MFLVTSEEWQMWAGELDGWERCACGSEPNSAGVSNALTWCVDCVRVFVSVWDETGIVGVVCGGSKLSAHVVGWWGDLMLIKGKVCLGGQGDYDAVFHSSSIFVLRSKGLWM